MNNNEELVEKVRVHLKEIINLLGIEENNSTEKTDYRIAKMWCNETLANRNDYNIDKLNASMKVFDNVDRIHDLVIVKDIHFNSICEHHFMPFFGNITVGYVPDEDIVGLSKIPRVVEYFSKKPQLQERLVKEIGEYLFELIRPRAIFVIARDSVHTCVLCRGIESECETDTVYSLYDHKEDHYKKEFYERIRR